MTSMSDLSGWDVDWRNWEKMILFKKCYDRL